MSVKSLREREIPSSLTFETKRNGFTFQQNQVIESHDESLSVQCSYYHYRCSILFLFYSVSQLRSNISMRSNLLIETSIQEITALIFLIYLFYSSLSSLKVISFLYTMKFTCKNVSVLPAETDVRQLSQEMMMVT